MNATSEAEILSPRGAPAPYVRYFGWAMLFVLLAFVINNILIVWFDYPSLATLLRENTDSRAWVLVACYGLALVAGALVVVRTPNRSLRYDAKRISDFNAYLIRGCFFAVLFVGIADFAIAFLRVEGLLDSLFTENLAKDLIRARFIGPFVHVPLVILGFIVAIFSRSLGFIWLALMIVVAELLIVISRFVFSYEQAMMGDLVRYWYAALFLFASAYTLLEEGHVRVDVLYAGFSNRRKGRVNSVGSILLGMTTVWAILLIGLGSKQAIINAPVANFEVSQTGTAGMFVKYQMAAFLAIFAMTMLIQFVSYLFEAVADARDEPGHRDRAAASH
ncbi:TRAP transporter small permease subunit [Sedimentitalea nanhaiensis]|uniref:TRAP transporter small permease protein n=1 Tax=Sedimentitalea nanhaiensis TaxID=999627 RepID=A0A1I7A0P7_9RHOB|nr:TRAP transporter small permease subunit [Sedimentitalea nanhaiensis]SFT68484.1 TRAP-type mannitol/chloroaromatic compound transport system, small permease component [Sedimentitalea nanhaiensis]